MATLVAVGHYVKPRPTDFTDLNSNYLDGVSISTNGEHVWSF